MNSHFMTPIQITHPTNDIDEMFESLFPKKDGKWTAVWVFNYVDP